MNLKTLAALVVVFNLVAPTISKAETYNNIIKINSILPKESMWLDSLKGKSLEKDTALKVVEINKDSNTSVNKFSIIKDEYLNNNHQPNLINGLLGEVAGAVVNSSGSAPGGAAFIKLRGTDGIGDIKNSQPLFILDGIIIDNNTSLLGATLISGNKTMSNRLVDINPNDIEEIQVLKPGAATAIYGRLGSNGVILINTKKGENGKVKINLSTDLGMDEIMSVPKVQQIYANGNTQLSTTTTQAWGPTFEQAKADNPEYSDVLYDNFNNAFKKGFYNKNLISISGGNNWGNFYSSVSGLSQDGVVPNTSFENITARLNGDITAIKKFNRFNKFSH